MGRKQRSLEIKVFQRGTKPDPIGMGQIPQKLKQNGNKLQKLLISSNAKYSTRRLYQRVHPSRVMGWWLVLLIINAVICGYLRKMR